MSFLLRKIRLSLCYQYSRADFNVETVIPDDVHITRSRKTHRIKTVFLGEKPLFRFRPMDGFFVPASLGAQKLHSALPDDLYRVWIDSSVSEFIRAGKTLFNKHVISSDPHIRIGDEILILDENGELLGYGSAIVPGVMMKSLSSGPAVKTRGGFPYS